MITLGDNITYVFIGTVDLLGNRLVAGDNTSIVGGSSENSLIKSTGLTSTALITSSYSLPMRHIAIQANIAVNLNGDSSKALDWHSLNFIDCPTIGTISNYSNFIMTDSAFLNSSGMTFDGTIGTIGFNGTLFNLYTGNTGITINGVVSRRFRIIYSSMIVPVGTDGIYISPSATINDESYILDTVNFSGGGTYLTGITGGNDITNKALFINCKGTGISNTYVSGQLYMNSNATASVISATGTFVPVAGTSSASPQNSRISVNNATLTCQASIRRKYLIQATLSFTSGNTNVCEFGFYDSTLSGIRTPSRTKSTSNGSGRSENISLFCVVEFVSGDYITLYCANNTAINNITVSDLNMMIIQL